MLLFCDYWKSLLVPSKSLGKSLKSLKSKNTHLDASSVEMHFFKQSPLSAELTFGFL